MIKKIITSKVWFGLVCFQLLLSIVCFLIVSIAFIFSQTPVEVKNTSLKAYENKWENPEDAWYPEEGYIPDAATAKMIGEKILNNCLGVSDIEKAVIPHETIVYYDEKNRLWMINTSYLLFYSSGKVVIDQDTGEVRYILLTKH